MPLTQVIWREADRRRRVLGCPKLTLQAEFISCDLTYIECEVVTLNLVILVSSYKARDRKVPFQGTFQLNNFAHQLYSKINDWSQLLGQLCTGEASLMLFPSYQSHWNNPLLFEHGRRIRTLIYQEEQAVNLCMHQCIWSWNKPWGMIRTVFHGSLCVVPTENLFFTLNKVKKMLIKYHFSTGN